MKLRGVVCEAKCQHGDLGQDESVCVNSLNSMTSQTTPIYPLTLGNKHTLN